MRPDARRGAAAGAPSETVCSTNRFGSPKGSPRLDQDADKLIVEALRFTEASTRGLASALLENDPGEIVAACEHSIVMGARVVRFLETALHVEFAEVA